MLPDRFQPVQVLGRGGMGLVVRCRDRQLNREVAVKLLRLESASARQRFLREAQVIGTLRHQHIVTVHDVAPGGEYLVMELVEGETLANRLRRAGRLPAPEVRRIAGALLGALAAAHHAGIIHRDVKPANVMLDGAGAVKLTDFGIAWISDSELTHTGQVIGTPAYMAPEQLRGGRATERADVYSAGATLFEVATGERLFRDGQRVAAPKERVLEATGDEVLAAAIDIAVREDSSERFESAEAFAKALAVHARPRSRLVRAAVVLGVALVLSAGLAAYLVLGGHRGATGRPIAVAMLPFADRAGDPRLDFASSGLPHLLGEQLGHVDGIKVLGYYRISGQVVDPSAPLDRWRDAARALGADVAIRGEMSPGPGGIHVTIVVERLDGDPLGRLERDVAVDRVPATVQSLASDVASAALGAPSRLPATGTRDFEIERELELGIAAFERMDFATARQHLNTVVERDEVAEAHYYLALLDWWQQLPPEPHISRALAGGLSPTQRDFMRGLRLLVDMQGSTAVAYFRELVRRAPDDRDAQYGLFEALFHGGDPSEAMHVYRRVRELAPRFDVGIEHALQYYLQHGDSAGIQWVRAHWDPASHEKSSLEGRQLMAEQGYADAIHSLERAAEEDPDAGLRLRRLLVEAYAVTGQLALAREASDRLATHDPNYATLAAFGLAVSAGGDVKGLRAQALHAVELGIPDVKPWAARLDLVALDLPGGDPALLREDSEGRPLTNRVEGVDIGVVILASALHDEAVLAAGRRSPFPQVVATTEALLAEHRRDWAAAIADWRRSIDLNSEGRLYLYSWYAIARDQRAAGDHAAVIAACDEVIAPRAFTWAWAATVGPCLRWSAEAASSLGRADDARRRWRTLLALRSAAPPGDELVRAARAALGEP